MRNGIFRAKGWVSSERREASCATDTIVQRLRHFCKQIQNGKADGIKPNASRRGGIAR
jgi:hypothetical protein